MTSLKITSKLQFLDSRVNGHKAAAKDLVVVKWSACLSSFPMIQVRIPFKSNYLL